MEAFWEGPIREVSLSTGELYEFPLGEREWKSIRAMTSSCMARMAR